jgi:eukaryotic-like serine/threonine-protein kinase
MSEIRRGDDVLLRRPVAVKLLREDGDPRSIARFTQEAQILARLHHPNVVTVFDTGVDGGEGFIVMELVEGPTLRELLDREGRLAPERAAEIASALASALGFAHEHGVIHRDLKPANVLFMPDGRVKLADMGIARLLSPEALTATLTLRGTPRYVSPEQARGDRVDSRADLYSLGCVLFEMLTGRTPFEGNLAALSYAHVHTPAPRVRSIDPAVPAGMDELVAAMLEKDPADRPQTGDDVRRSLDAAMRHAAVPQTAPMEAVPTDPTRRLPVGDDLRPGPSVRPRRSVWPWIVIPLGLLAIIVLIALIARSGSDGRTDEAQRSTPGGGSPTTEQSPPEEPAGLSAEEAAGVVFQTVGDGVEAGEVTDHAGKDILHEMDEILRELDHDGDVEKAVEKLGELREKVSEALEKGEITSAARASAIDDALLGFAEALGDAEE